MDAEDTPLPVVVPNPVVMVARFDPRPTPLFVIPEGTPPAVVWQMRQGAIGPTPQTMPTCVGGQCQQQQQQPQQRAGVFRRR